MESTVAAPEPFSAEHYLEELRSVDLIRTNGKVRQVIGTVIESNGPPMAIGETATISYKRTAAPVLAEAVGFRDAKVLLMPLGELGGIAAGSEVVALGRPLLLGLSEALLGRVLDGLGRPIDGLGRPVDGLGPIGGPNARSRDVQAPPPDPLERPRIRERVSLGVRALDALVPCGRGQRLGIFAGSGVGKSSLLGMIARSTSA
ncbi:MAG TPA: hypothetical protein VE591_15345, partial [Candidatus Acidoferrum sp.]|nr:hypothetical protein [Candidatus Acidoferrum sp.]